MGQSNSYTFIFITVVAIVAALILSVASQSLQQKQVQNFERDMKRNILSAVGLLEKKGCDSDIEGCYKKMIKAKIINTKGKAIDARGLIPVTISIEEELGKEPSERRYPLFMRRDKGKTTAYCIPIVGKGLWSTLYGYLALEKDLKTVKGITFYKHAETPGLGAEIETTLFRESFKGKKILDKKGKLVSVRVVKGSVNPQSPMKMHEVDGISGATLTCNGVTDLIKASLELYEPHFKELRRK